MSSPLPGNPGAFASLSSRMAPPSMVDIRRKAHLRLAERIDPARTRHKPLSLLRQEAKRLVEQFVESECSALSKPERDQLAEDVLAEAAGVSPLEELFRDDAVKEIQVLAADQVIARKADVWLPTSVRYRNDEQLRGVLTRFAEVGESVVESPTLAGGYDVRLPNGFRAMAVIPPSVMNIPPMVLLTRLPVPAPLPGDTVGPGSGILSSAVRPSNGPLSSSRIVAQPPPRDIASESGRLPRPSGMVPTVPSRSGLNSDPLARIRARVTARIINQLAAAGVHDINVLPLPELRKVVAAYVQEQCDLDPLGGYDGPAREKLVLEILAGMNR